MTNMYATKIWILLVVLTLLSYVLSQAGYSGQSFVAVLVVTAFIKGQMIIDHFMLLKTAPLLWRLIVSFWLVTVLVLIAALYFSYG